MSQDIRRSIYKLYIYSLSFNSRKLILCFFNNYHYNSKTLRYRSNKTCGKYVCLKLQNHERNRKDLKNEVTPCSWIGNFNAVNTLYPANRVNSVSIKISRYFVFFNKIDYLILNIWKDKEFEAARTILKNTNNF